jgi:hypothetical protein
LGRRNGVGERALTAAHALSPLSRQPSSSRTEPFAVRRQPANLKGSGTLSEKGGGEAARAPEFAVAAGALDGEPGLEQRRPSMHLQLNIAVVLRGDIAQATEDAQEDWECCEIREGAAATLLTRTAPSAAERKRGPAFLGLPESAEAVDDENAGGSKKKAVASGPRMSRREQSLPSSSCMNSSELVEGHISPKRSVRSQRCAVGGSEAGAGGEGGALPRRSRPAPGLAMSRERQQGTHAHGPPRGCDACSSPGELPGVESVCGGPAPGMRPAGAWSVRLRKRSSWAKRRTPSSLRRSP